MGKTKVLFVGESWVIVSQHIKGIDHFTDSFYEEGVQWIRKALETDNDMDFTYMPSHIAMHEFPNTLEGLKEFDCIIFSDIGYNTIMLHPDTMQRCLRTPNRLKLLKEYVLGGGSFMMIGGYLSFSGIEARGHYKDSPVEEILPVELLRGDDRKECPEGEYPSKVDASHVILDGIDEEFPFFLSYNRVFPKDEGTTILSFEDNPLLVVWDIGKGRTAAFAADCAPHGAPPEFLNWKYFSKFWGQLVNWLVKK